MPHLEFLGVGAATDFARGQTSVLYRGRVVLLIDCGPQIPAALVPRLSGPLGPSLLDGVYLTHRHADHCFGLGGLLLWQRTQGRTKKLHLLGSTETLSSVKTLLELGYPGAFAPEKCFPIEYTPLETLVMFDFCDCGLSVAQTAHNVRNDALCIDDGSTRIAFSGDGLHTAQSTELFTGCDLVVQECAYAEREHSHHMNFPRVLEMIEVAKPKRTVLVHCLEEQRAIVEALVQKQRSIIQVAHPGDVISV
jgi:ribonuclease BN (tRNA processing enzyme)